MINGFEGFTYLGYTMGDPGSPTFYFKEGRYTQKHNHPENVGWHPVKTYHLAANITKAAAAEYKALNALIKKAEEDDDEDGEDETIRLNGLKTEFKRRFVNGEFNALDTDVTAIYFECSTNIELNKNDYSKWAGHISRARLIKLTDKLFMVQYDEAAAKKVLAKGELADNEKSKRQKVN